MANKSTELFSSTERRFAGTMLTPAQAAGNHSYYFELWSETKNQRLGAVKCPYVQRIDAAYIPATELTFTIKSQYEEHEGFRARVFQLQGVSGYTTRDMVAFKAFMNFWELVQEVKSTHLSAFHRGEDIRVILHFPFEGESFYCNLIDGLTYARDRSSNCFSFVWGLKVQATGYAARVWSMPTVIRVFLIKDCSSELDTCHTGLRHPCREVAIKVKEKLDPQSSVISESLEGLHERADDIERKGELTGPDNFQDYNDLLRDGSINLDDSINFIYKQPPSVVARNIYSYIDAIGWMANLIMEAKIGVGMWGVGASLGISLGVPALGWGVSLNASVRAQASVLAPGLSFYFSAAFYQRPRRNPLIDFQQQRPPMEQPTLSTKVGPGERSALEAFERSTGREPQVITFPPLTTGLMNPLQWQDGRWVEPGDIISVPDESGLPNVREPLGVDWRVEGGDFVWNDDAGDFTRVTGSACYLQNWAHRLLTEKGSNRGFPLFGMADLGSDDTQREAMLVAEVQRLTSADPRTRRIVSMSMRVEPPTIYVDVVAELIDGSRVNRTITG